MSICPQVTERGTSLTATKILWGQILVVFAIVLATLWAATQWTAWRLGFQPQLGLPWFELAGFPVYLPPIFILVVVPFRRLRALDLPRRCGHRGLGRICFNWCSYRHVGVAGAGSQLHHDLRIGPLGHEE
jgi:hypothetical protein